MTSVPAESMALRSRRAWTIKIVVLSLVLPVVVIIWSATTALNDKLVWERPWDILKLHPLGSVRDGELWFTEAQLDANPTVRAKESRIKRLDLQTGVERDTGLVVAGDFAHPKWLGDKLYLVSSNAIYEVRGDSLVQIAASLPSMGPSHSLVFLYEDRLTTIRERETGRRYLTHLIDGQWVDGREIVLPGPDLAWYHDHERGQTVLLPRTSQPAHGAFARNCSLCVVQHGTQHLLMLTNYQQGFAAYRAGFLFADEERDAASAVAPENAPLEAFGWIPIGEPLDAGKSPLGGWMQMVSTSHGPLFVFWGSKRQVFQPASDGRWEELTGLSESNKWGGYLLPDTSGSTNYIVYADGTWGSLEVRRLDTDARQTATLVVPGYEREYVGPWRTLVLGVLFAWLLHIAVLIGGAEWFVRRGYSEKYVFGVEQASLASVWRRAVATTVDVVLMLIVLSLLWLLCCWVFGFKREPFHGTMLADSLLRIEGLLSYGPRGFKDIPEALLGSPLGWLVHPFVVGRDFPSLWVAALFVAGGLKVLFEGRVGVTPGKWLLGIRTVDVTLRPCGISKAIVRSVFYCFDLPFLLTPLPAVVSLMLSEHRQTWGDRAAQTLVIRAGSICRTGTPARTSLSR
ncbi:MAG: RDD family protein [Planctomycetales bacterium]|nr:RDD family protein [Planctomycetales bacterium]